MVESEEELRVFEPVVEEGRAPARAIEAGGPLERIAVWFLLNQYRGRLRAFLWEAPTWVTEEIFSACQSIAGDGPAVGLGRSRS